MKWWYDEARKFYAGLTPEQEVEFNSRLTRVMQNDVVLDYEFKTVPYRHQRIAFNFARELDRSALFMEMGTGKSKVAIDVLCWRHLRGEVNNVLVVAPNSVLENWNVEWDTHATVPTLIYVARGSKQRRMELLLASASFGNSPSEKLRVGVINYEALREWRDEIKKFAGCWDAVVADESTKLKNSQSHQSKAMWRLFKSTRYKLILTGTPATQSPLDIYGQYRFLDESVFGTKWFEFKNRYAIMGGYGGYEVVDYQNTDELKRLVDLRAIRFLKSECLDLPDKVYSVLRCDMLPEQERIYREMSKLMVAEIEELGTVTAQIVLTKILRLQQITSGHVPLDDQDGPGGIRSIPSAKHKLLEEVLEDAVAAQRKIIIWARFIRDINDIAKLCKDKLDVNFVTMHGAVPSRDRQAIVDAFQNDASVLVFIGQPATGGLGINLTMADRVVYFSNTWSLQERLQSEDRAHRIGQKQSVTYIDLICRGTIDESIVRAIAAKEELASIITGDNLRAIIEGKEVK